MSKFSADQRFLNLIEDFNGGIAIHRDGIVIFINDAACKMHGYTREEVLGKPITTFISPDDIERLIERAAARMRGEAVPDRYEYKGLTKDGSTMVVELQAQPIEWEGGPAVLMHLDDVTEKRKAEAKAMQLGRIIEQSLDEAYMFEADSLKFVWANRGAQENLGYSIEELSKMSPTDVLPASAQEGLEDIFNSLVSGEVEKYEFETTLVRKDGSTYEIEAHLQYIKEENPPVFVGNVRDITERQQREKELKEATYKAEAASRAKSEFLANMSHELRTPLHAIIGYSELLTLKKLDPGNPDKSLEYIEQIHESGSHLLSLINDILDISRIESGNMSLREEEFDLGHAIRACVKMVEGMARDAGLTLETQLPEDLPTVYADERAIKQILINLLGNAIKFTPKEGHITLRAWQDEDGEINMSVRDTGIGMSAEELARVRQPFYQVDNSLTRERSGTGLGLSLVVSYLELHGGRHEIDSEPGKGTHVHMSLPAWRVYAPSSGDFKSTA